MAFHGAHLAERGGVVAHCECVAIDSPGREAAALDLERIFAHPLAPPTQDGFPAMGREGRVVLISGGLPDGHLATGSYVGEKEILVIGLFPGFLGVSGGRPDDPGVGDVRIAVSYTHLTLPTKA